MGSSSSKEKKHHFRRKHKNREPEHEPEVSEPQGLQIVPAPERDEEGRPVRHKEYDLNRNNLNKALHYVAEFLHGKSQNVTIIAVGGAVNTIFLRTRNVTHDVDFFNGHISHDAALADLLRQAATNAAARSSVPLGGNWLNNSTVLFMSEALQIELTDAAVAQDEVIFQEPGLRVLAAPWGYAICAKLERMGKSNRREYDLKDAAIYLRRHILKHDNRPVSAAEIEEWGRHYKIQCSRAAIQELANEYHETYNAVGVTF
ncbi:hypothetical protein PRK78_006692 [Emydomyces testavorans]|uniref:DUF7582 domain-containing protein n=1 Tax=Emydomyces testavorans TaxID=2070801 RepID=A0AAF0DM86_9EURO|nr:hypothetical protein PRK78_006692 [Emydomyces testavorans]